MIKRLIHCTTLLTIALSLSGTIAPAQTPKNSDQTHSNQIVTDVGGGLRLYNLLARARHPRVAQFALMPWSAYANAGGPSFSITPLAAGPNLQVLGGGTLGRLTRWAGFSSSNSFIGDSTIFEDKNGLVGIGTDTPTSRLTVAGTIQSLSGGFQFPDGTIQTTSGAGSLVTVAHDLTLSGNGTAVSPLGVAVPLILSGSVLGNGLIQVTNNAVGQNSSAIMANAGTSGIGISANGGDDPDQGGDSLHAFAGDGGTGQGGRGVLAVGGDSVAQRGGNAIQGEGGRSTDGDGGLGLLANGGFSTNAKGGTGVFASGSNGNTGGHGVIAEAGNSNGAGNSGGIGIEARAGVGGTGGSPGLAGRFEGDVLITGVLNVTSGTKNFKIDHPLDPENKYLYHAAVESAEVLNVYSGNVTTNHNGEAVVTLPDWFESLNRDLRYQLTVIGTFAQAIVSQKVTGNRFIIRTNAPNVEVSWLLTGLRSDASMKKHAFKAEEEKPARERGTYLNPDAYGQPEERGVEWVRNPEMRQRLKQRRIDAEQKDKANR